MGYAMPYGTRFSPKMPSPPSPRRKPMPSCGLVVTVALSSHWHHAVTGPRNPGFPAPLAQPPCVLPALQTSKVLVRG
jgi:hypothetical protein